MPFPTHRKTPWRLSAPQKARQRKRLRAVDRVVDTLSAALARNGQSAKAVERWYAEMPREEEMLPKDKYTIFDKKEKRYRKSIHSTLFLSVCCSLAAKALWMILIHFSSHRTAQVDSCQPACEPPWFLSPEPLLLRTPLSIRRHIPCATSNSTFVLYTPCSIAPVLHEMGGASLTT